MDPPGNGQSASLTVDAEEKSCTREPLPLLHARRPVGRPRKAVSTQGEHPRGVLPLLTVAAVPPRLLDLDAFTPNGGTVTLRQQG